MKRILFIWTMCVASFLHAQKHDNIWLLGYGGGNQSPLNDSFGISILRFNSLNQLSILNNQQSDLNLRAANSSLSDSTGKFLFLGGVPDRLNRIWLLYQLYNRGLLPHAEWSFFPPWTSEQKSNSLQYFPTSADYYDFVKKQNTLTGFTPPADDKVTSYGLTSFLNVNMDPGQLGGNRYFYYSASPEQIQGKQDIKGFDYLFPVQYYNGWEDLPIVSYPAMRSKNNSVYLLKV